MTTSRVQTLSNMTVRCSPDMQYFTESEPHISDACKRCGERSDMLESDYDSCDTFMADYGEVRCVPLQGAAWSHARIFS